MTEVLQPAAHLTAERRSEHAQPGRGESAPLCWIYNTTWKESIISGAKTAIKQINFTAELVSSAVRRGLLLPLKTSFGHFRNVQTEKNPSERSFNFNFVFQFCIEVIKNFFHVKFDHNWNLLLLCRLKTEPKWKKKTESDFAFLSL